MSIDFRSSEINFRNKLQLTAHKFSLSELNVYGMDDNNFCQVIKFNAFLKSTPWALGNNGRYAVNIMLFSCSQYAQFTSLGSCVRFIFLSEYEAGMFTVERSATISMVRCFHLNRFLQ